jgi:hypothetical protein
MDVAYGRAMRSLVVLLVLAVLAGPGAAAASADAARTGCSACTVQTGPGQYVGSLLIPPGSRPEPPGLPSVARSCDGCVWTLEPACQSPVATGGVVCPGALRACPAPQLRLALLLQRPGEPVATRVGTFCLAPGVPLQPGALVPGVRDRFVRLVPPLRPSFQPRGFGIVNVPVLLAAGQPGDIGRPVFTLAGHRVALTATASWVWRYGDGSRLATSRPGGAWPDVDVAHAYGRDGRYVTMVTTTWQGQFWVDGAGPFVIDGDPVTQDAQIVVPVRAAVAQLLGTG